MGKRISKNLSIICSQKLLDQRKQPATDALKTASKSAIHKTAEASDSFIDNKTAERKFQKRHYRIKKKYIYIYIYIYTYIIYIYKKHRKLLMI